MKVAVFLNDQRTKNVTGVTKLEVLHSLLNGAPRGSLVLAREGEHQAIFLPGFWQGYECSSE